MSEQPALERTETSPRIAVAAEAERRSTLTSTLQGAGFDVAGWEHHEVLERLTGERYALLVVPLAAPASHPELDVHALIREVKGLRDVHAPRVLAMGVGEMAEMIAALEAGADAYLGEPATAPQLTALVTTMLNA